MNFWTKQSITLANQGDYLDQLYKVYPMSKNIKREPDESVINNVANYMVENGTDSNKSFLKYLFSSQLSKNFSFPVKDSYVAFLKRDKSSIDRNPMTVNRISGMIHELGTDKVISKMSRPIETNRQIGPLFKRWIDKGSLGIEVTDNVDHFIGSEGNVIFNSGDYAMMQFAKDYLGYKRNKGLDFLCKFNGIFLIGEAKFLTDFGGHQNDQIEDAFLTLRAELSSSEFKVKKIAILDGVVFLNGKNKMHRMLEDASDNEVILSSLFLRDFIYSL